QTELKNKVQNFDGKRIDPKEEYGSQGENLIKKLVRQFDPLDDMASGYATMMTGESLPVSPYFRKKSDLFSSSSTPVTFRNESNSSPSVFHPSICEIPSNRVNYILQNIRSTYGTTPLQTVKITPPSSSFARHISPQPTPNLMNFSPRYPSIQPYRTQKQQQTFSETQSSLFDPLLPTTTKITNNIGTQSVHNTDILFDPVQQNKESLYPILPPPTSHESHTHSHQLNSNSTTNLIDF
ncbi:unnamed protein product, partial [Didymodactylos carnosus]